MLLLLSRTLGLGKGRIRHDKLHISYKGSSVASEEGVAQSNSLLVAEVFTTLEPKICLG